MFELIVVAVGAISAACALERGEAKRQREALEREEERAQRLQAFDDANDARAKRNGYRVLR